MLLVMIFVLSAQSPTFDRQLIVSLIFIAFSTLRIVRTEHCGFSLDLSQTTLRSR
jgi:hypothetical protein